MPVLFGRYSDTSWFDRFQSAAIDAGLIIDFDLLEPLFSIEEDHLQRYGFPKYFYLTFFDYCHRNKIDRVTKHHLSYFLAN